MPPRLVRAIVVRKQIHYRAVRPARPVPSRMQPKPPKRGGGWLVAVGVVGALVVVGKLAGGASAPAMPEEQHHQERRVIATGQGSRENRCDVPGVVNGVPVTFEVDTGDPNPADFAASYIRKLGFNPTSLEWSELDPGTRYGKVANAKAREIRIGDVVWTDQTITFFSNWRYSFGDDEQPLFGLPSLRARGVQLEWMQDGNCRLTVAQ
jgi:hypothetical protein